MSDWLNDTLKNEYQFVKLIHRNKNSEIKLFRHKKLNTDIAVHLINNNTDLSVYNILKYLSDKNIIRVYDAFKTDNQTVIIEEYIDGITLWENIGNMNTRGIKNILVQICDGLSAIHSVGIVHRDINPNNIMIDSNGTVKIIDFNISKIYRTSDTNDNNTMGTVGYAPFEQYGLTSTDERTDIFSFGVTANILLTGQHPSVKLYTKGNFGKAIKICTDINPDKRFKSISEIYKFLR